MPLSELERRRTPRRVPAADETLCRVRLRTGRELTVVNISSCSVLLEGLTRLLPGTRAEVHVVTRHGRVLVRTRVVRSLVWHLDPDAVCYRTALAFETEIDTEAGLTESERSESSGLALSERSESNGYPIPADFSGNVEGRGTRYPNDEAAERV